MIGETIKDIYKIYEVVSKEPITAVYLGRNQQTNEIVAVEIIRKRIFDEVLGIARTEWNQRFRHEVDTLARVRSPHIARILDYGEQENAIFVVSEYVPGKSLAQVIEERGSLSVEEALDIAQQIATGLEAAHRSGLSHGDLRPSNIMLSGGGLVEILEFGTARSFLVEGLMPRALVEMPYYAAPEQGEGEDPDIRSDIYAVGVILYEMLTGKLPFRSDDAAHLILKHINEPAPSVQVLRPDIPGEVDTLVSRCLAKQPADRFQNPAEVVAAITAILSPQAVALTPKLEEEKARVSEAKPAAPPPTVALPPTPVPPPVEPPPPAAPPELPRQEPAPRPVPTPAVAPKAEPVPTKERRKRNPILLGAGAGGAIIVLVLIALLAGRLFGGGTGSKLGAIATAAAEAGIPATPTLTAAEEAVTTVMAQLTADALAMPTSTPTMTPMPTVTPTPTPLRCYLPFVCTE